MQFLANMGLLKPVKTELPESARPLYPDADWGQIQTATIGFGQGISVAPLIFRHRRGRSGQWRPPHHPDLPQAIRHRPARRTGDQAGNQRSRCATCCAMS